MPINWYIGIGIINQYKPTFGLKARPKVSFVAYFGIPNYKDDLHKEVGKKQTYFLLGIYKPSIK